MQENVVKISEIKQRILQIIEHKGITPYEFCKKTGISKSNLSGKSLESEIGGKQISQILNYYTDISSDWLLLGKGEMIRKNSEISTVTCPPSADQLSPGDLDSQSLPLIPFDALAGIPSIDNFGIAFADCEQYAIPEFSARGVDFLIRVSGSSMYPKYSNGDILACSLVRDILFFQWGKVYVIDSSQGVLVKRIFQSEKPDCILLVSDNREHYPPFNFPTSDIRTLAIVMGVIRIE